MWQGTKQRVLEELKQLLSHEMELLSSPASKNPHHHWSVHQYVSTINDSHQNIFNNTFTANRKLAKKTAFFNQDCFPQKANDQYSTIKKKTYSISSIFLRKGRWFDSTPSPAASTGTHSARHQRCIWKGTRLCHEFLILETLCATFVAGGTSRAGGSFLFRWQEGKNGR